MKQIKSLLGSVKTRNADIVIYSARLSENTTASMNKFIQLVQRTSNSEDLRIIIMDRAVSFKNLHSEAVRAYGRGVSPEDINRYALQMATGPFYFDTMQAELAKNHLPEDIIIVSKRQLQCNKHACDFFTGDGNLAIWDTDHWTLPGAKMFMSRFIKENPDIFQRDIRSN